MGIDELQKIRSIRWDGFWQITNSLLETFLNLPIFMTLLPIHTFNACDLVIPTSFEVISADTRIEMTIGMRGDGTIFSSETPLLLTIHY